MQSSAKPEWESPFQDQPQSPTKPEIPSSRIPLPARPFLRRDQSVPSSQQILSVPPPPPPPLPQQKYVNNDPTINTDPLSFGHLKRLVNDMPTAEPAPYAFTYADTASFHEELEEWFTYSKEEQTMMLTVWRSFTKLWEEYQFTSLSEQEDYREADTDWTNATESKRIDFLKSLKAEIQQHDKAKKVQGLEALTYIAVGCWHETAGAEVEKGPELSSNEIRNSHPSHNNSFTEQANSQLSWIKTNIKLITTMEILQPVFEMLVQLCQEDRWYSHQYVHHIG